MDNQPAPPPMPDQQQSQGPPEYQPQPYQDPSAYQPQPYYPQLQSAPGPYSPYPYSQQQSGSSALALALAIVSLFLGTTSIVLLILYRFYFVWHATIIGIIAIILGAISLSDKSGRGKGMAIGGIVTGTMSTSTVSFIIIGSIFILMIAH